MTRGSIQEYTEAVRERYLRASKKEKARIWDEFVNVTGYHRKSASAYCIGDATEFRVGDVGASRNMPLT